MNPWMAALMIFCLRIGDVSFGTMRVVFLVRGRRAPAALMAVCESFVYLLAIARVLRGDLNPPLIIGYATGYATGTAVGITLENWIALGSIMVRIISQNHSGELREKLLERHFGVTAVTGQGRDGDVQVLFVAARRRRSSEVLNMIDEIDPTAFVTVDPIGVANGGHLPVFPRATALKK